MSLRVAAAVVFGLDVRLSLACAPPLSQSREVRAQLCSPILLTSSQAGKGDMPRSRIFCVSDCPWLAKCKWFASCSAMLEQVLAT